MTSGRRHSRRALCWSQAAPALRPAQRPAPRAPAARAPAAERSPHSPAAPATPLLRTGDEHPLTRLEENERLATYEASTKQAFDRIVPTLKEIAACQHDRDFEQRAQDIARERLGFRLPERVLDHAWVEQLDMRTLFAWCVFETYRRFAGEFFTADPLGDASLADFGEFLQACGFHSFDLSPCSDGRLAHVVRYALRLPPRQVRRKSHAGAMFDVEESLDRWVETELNRFREGVPNTADQPTRYLKIAMYHYSGTAPGSEGCAAHGCDATRAAEAARERLLDFQQAIQNSFCCGASIDLLLLGIDTDTDTLRVHVPDADGALSVDRWLDAGEAYERTRRMAAGEVEDAIAALAAERAEADGAGAPPGGMLRLIARLLGNNFSQIDYVKARHGGRYPDIGHQERFIGVGKGYDEIQLRNLTFFAHLKTVEEAACDLDVGIGIFTRLNASRGLPVPVIVRFDYHGAVPGARRRAAERCRRVSQALLKRYPDLAKGGLLHTLLAIRDCRGDAPIEILGSSLDALTAPEGGAH